MSTLQNDACTFPQSRTCRSLVASALGEHHAHRQYLHAARTMEEAGMQVIAHAFRFTAAQEKEHAAIFRGLLAAYGGDRLPLVEDAPILLPRTPRELLAAVTSSEQEESEKLYPLHARTAELEGYPRIATAFRRIAETEQLHARRFRQYADALEDDTLFRDEARVGWLCLPCGQLRYGQEAPRVCPACGRGQGGFIRSSFWPFSVDGHAHT